MVAEDSRFEMDQQIVDKLIQNKVDGVSDSKVDAVDLAMG